MPTYDFGCTCGQVTELRKGYGVTSIPCPACGNEANRLAVYPGQFIVTETGAKGGRRAEVPLSDRRYNVSRFEEASQELDYAHVKAENEVGHELPSPSYYKHAMARAEGINPNFRASQENNKLRKRAKRRELVEAAAAEGSTLDGAPRA